MSIVEQLYTAYSANEPLALGALDIASIEQAYSIQNAVMKMKEENGEVLMGYKVSLTSQETQDLFNSSSPLYGVMTDRTVKKEINLSDFNMPLLEMELVFLIDEEITAEDTAVQIMEKCRVAPGAEVPDARYKNWFPNTALVEIIADGAVNGAVIYGEAKRYDYDDLDNIKGTLSHDGTILKEGRSTEVLGHPAKAIEWLAGTLAEEGKVLKPGLFVSSGTFNLPIALEPGTYEIQYENVGTVTFEVNA
ncbi:2-keto-4-pentenoate hydratase [Salinicoccus hispanicus]|uniref:Hydratase n=1 Tax=Salinicoccus hispanicus TaxID=157225 RepID=A0A6N8TZ11_9STAP|nr:hydratase [Salinicoccus hispanicus]MXQ51238.1 hydratase [Salinicoccus hispanicus]